MVAALAVAAGLAALANHWSGGSEPGSPAQPAQPQAPVVATPTAATPDQAAEDPNEGPPVLSEAEALRGSIKTVSCAPELAGKTSLSTEEMAPSHEAVQAMEGCLDLTVARHRQHRAIRLTIVYYLAPDGSVSDTGIGADVDTAEAWELLEPCARGYWQTYPPKVTPSDEQSFSCAYEWSEASIAGGAASVGAKVARIWAGQDTAIFGSSIAVDQGP